MNLLRREIKSRKQGDRMQEHTVACSNNQHNHTESFSQKLWRYGKQALKGAVLFGVGVLGYVSLKRFSRSGDEGAVQRIDKPRQLGQVISSEKNKIHAKKQHAKSLLYRRSGPELGEVFQVSTYVATYEGRLNSAVAPLGDGQFVVTWVKTLNFSDSDVYGQLFSRLADKVGSEFQVNSYTPGVQAYSSVAGSKIGNFMVAWQSPSPPTSICGRYFDNNSESEKFRVFTHVTTN